jgi:hypothetical protein
VSRDDREGLMAWLTGAVRHAPDERPRQRPDLDLGGILGGDRSHYDGVLGRSGLFILDSPGEWTWDLQALPGERSPSHAVALPGIERAGGPAETASSCTALQPYPAACWDVCGYYRRLGIGWRAGWKEMREAYTRLGGQDDPDLTYAMKQLLDPGLRREYDALPLGALWLRDRDTADRVRRDSIRESARRRSRGSGISADEVLDEWGYGTTQDRPDAAEAAVLPDWARQRGSRPWDCDWSYYVLGDPAARGAFDPVRVREALLPRWQQALAAALSRAGKHVSFAVGVSPDTPDGFFLATSPYTDSLIIFLASDYPEGITAERAAQAVSRD